MVILVSLKYFFLYEVGENNSESYDTNYWAFCSYF